MEFKRIMHLVAEAWSDGKIEKAADYYTEQALFEFCGNLRLKPPIKFVWFHLSFDEAKQTGYGEYNFMRMGVGDRSVYLINGYRAIATIKICDGKISNWREYRGVGGR
jgi:hypothetical protein